MKILYIHGLDSSPTPEKLQIIRNYGHEVCALHLNYREEPECYNILLKFAQDEQAQGIVGSSFGGFLGFWIAETLGLPCLLFNPALYFDNIPLTFDKNVANCPARFVVLGDQDERVDPNLNWTFLKEVERPSCHQRVTRCQWLAHQIDLETFDESVRWALPGFATSPNNPTDAQ
ncbi:MAG: YqiA/YcfP family alpha/beta fold hydrolase [Bacteroidota bacterium]